MTRFAIDAPALLALVRDGRPVDPRHQLVAPNAIRSHALDLLLRAVADGELGNDEALALHERITERRMRLLGDRVSRRIAWDLARRHGWDSVRDAEYLAVARLQADALIASGIGLRDKAVGLVALAPLSALYE